MRTLLLFLVILNLLYAGWNYLMPVNQLEDLPPMADNLATLELLNEPLSASNEVAESGDEPSQSDSNDIKAITTEDDSAELTEEEAPVIADKSQQERLCYSMGPFRDQAIMEQLKASLQEKVSKVTVRKLEESEKHRYWVYMPPMQSRKHAKQKARELREKKIKDFYIVLSGGTKNGISLGHFKEPKHANRRLKQVNKLGLEAEIEVIYRKYSLYWLDYSLAGKEIDDGELLKEYLSEGVSQLSRSCEKG